MCLDPVDVVRMNLRSTVALTPLVESDAVIRERDSVRIQALGPGSQDADKLGREIQHLPELCFLFPDLFLGRLTLRDVGHRPDKLPTAGCILYRVRDRVDVLDSPVRQ